MTKYGIKDNELNWFKSYLSDRRQMVKCHGQTSDSSDITIGVPQGSIVGPLLFLLFINDLTQHVFGGSCNLFADDTLIYASGRDLGEVRTNLQTAVTGAERWFGGNRLVVNRPKSNTLLVSNRKNSTSLDIEFKGQNFKQVDYAKYLGICIDGQMNWNQQISYLSKIVSNKLYILRKLRSVLSKESLEIIYKSCIQPVMDYCDTVWDVCGAAGSRKAQGLQNQAARIITGNFDFINTRGEELVRELKWQTLSERRTFHVATLMFKCVNGQAPNYLCDQINLLSDVNNYRTRSTNSRCFSPHS